MERLLAALVAVQPGHEASAVCMQALEAGALSRLAAFAAVEPLWAHGRCAVGSTSDAEVGESGCSDLPATASWLSLPAQREKPAAPVLPPRPVVESPEPALDEVTTPGFYRERGGDMVHISEDGLRARHCDDSGDLMQGVLLSAEHVHVGRAGLYFEVELLEKRLEECFDGLTIGVTTTCPSEVVGDPPTVEHIPNTWAVGYDGQMWDPGAHTLSPVDWDPRSLDVGDRVGVLVTLSEGELLVFHNGVACCPGPRGIPVSSEPLYAIVDLLGAARATRWVEDAVPPIGERGGCGP